MRRLRIATIAATSTLLLVTSSAASADPVAEALSRHTVDKFTAKLDPPLAEALKNVRLARLLGSNCPDQRVVLPTLEAYARARIGTPDKTAIADADFIVGRVFWGLTRDDLGALCRASGEFFGPKGHLVPGAIRGAVGSPALPLGDPARPDLEQSP